MKKIIVLLLATVVATSACASMRGVSVGTDQQQSSSFQVSVHNSKDYSVTVTWIDGNGSRILGTLAADETRSFSVYSSGTMRATNSSGGTVATKSVNYGNTKSVTI